MPAVTLGFEEIEDRLRRLRRRLNLFAAQQVGYVGGSVLALAGAALIVAALRGSPAMFAATFWLALAAALTAVIAAPLRLRQRWCDLAHVAALVDRRAQLQDRMVTLLAARTRRPPSRLAGLLLADTLALGARWEPRTLAPRRVPRSVFLLLAALATLAATALISRRESPHSDTVAVAGTSGAEVNEGAALAGGAAMGKPQPAPAADQQGTALPPSSAQASGNQAGNGSDAGTLPGAGEAGPPALPGAALAGNVQHLIQQALNAEAAGEPQQLAARGAGDRGDASAQDKQAGTGSAKPPGSAGSPGEGQRANAPAPANAAGARSNQPNQGEPQQPKEVNNANAGSGAGSGSGGGNLLASKSGPAGSPLGEPRTFKLTLTSFLQGTAPKPAPQRPASRGRVNDEGFATAARSAAQLSEQQADDDLVRKADIPPEFEEIVRRVFSQRPAS